MGSRERFNPGPGVGPKGGVGSRRAVAVTVVWEGDELEARAFGRLMKHLIADLEGTADRRLLLKWRQAWLTGCEGAGVSDA